MSLVSLEKMNQKILRKYNYKLNIMSDNKEKVYLGYGKEVGNYGMINFSLEENVIKENLVDYKGKKYLRATISKLKSPTQYGQTHTITLDQYTPVKKDNQSTDSVSGGDGLPW